MRKRSSDLSEKEKTTHWLPRNRERVFKANVQGHFNSDGLFLSPRPFQATDWPLPPRSGLFGFLLLVRFLGSGDLLGAVKERAQRHPAEDISMGLLDELHQLTDVTVQTLGMKSESEGCVSWMACETTQEDQAAMTLH